ncbi:MAG: carboxypeptidase-like regulatory domain-containing protein [Bryocella sp.]
MKFHPIRTVALILALASLCAPAQEPAPPPSAAPPSAPSLSTQQPAAPELPDAPQPVASSKLSGTISGTVKDVNDAIVPGAKIQLVTGTSAERTTTADDTGAFTFNAIAPGPFTLIITEPGLEPLTLTGRMKPGEARTVPKIAMRIATAVQSVDAISVEQLAELEIKQQEKQRVLGAVPNFFVSYNWRAQPLTVKQKFDLGLHATLDPTHFAFAAIRAGVEQGVDSFPGFDCNPPVPGFCWSAFGKRYAAALADSATGTMLRGSIMPSIFHQDPRYFYKGTGTIKSRAVYAILTSVRTRGDNGHWQPSSGILASFADGAISNLYYAPSDRHGVDLTLENGALSIAAVAVGHLLQEFVYKHLTPGLAHAPVDASSGK